MQEKIFEQVLKIFGGDRYRDTPVTISNTEVKSVPPMILAWQRVGKAGAAKLNKASVCPGLYSFKAFFLNFFFDRLGS